MLMRPGKLVFGREQVLRSDLKSMAAGKEIRQREISKAKRGQLSKLP